jgi:peptidoglycan/xylan/chitin deacetylase (PgdA/CDA1 family)
MHRSFALSIAAALLGCASALNAAPASGGAEPEPASPSLPAAPKPPAPDKTRVAILGYHAFSETEPETEMRIRTSKFRAQLEVIRDLGLSVISLDQFIRWKDGELDLPGKCVMITIDDGWKSVYTDAWPIFQEFGYPFAVFLYKNYVEGGDRSLTKAMIREMMKNGMTIGSHSVSHPYPADFKKAKAMGPEAYARFMRTEMGESKRFLEMTFGQRVNTYVYPGGYVTDDMFPLADELGYTHLFTVQPGKVVRDTPNRTLPRYMILGTRDRVFELAVDFHDTPAPPPGTVAGLTRKTNHPVAPPPGSICNDRLPLVEADLSGIQDLDPESPTMKIDGFGTVPARFDPSTRRFSWKVNRRLRRRFCHVTVTWKNTEGKSTEKPLSWSFEIDRSAAYLPLGSSK